MRCFQLSIILLAGTVLIVGPSIRSQPNSNTPTTSPGPQIEEKTAKRSAEDRTADDAAIRANVDAFAKASNAKDAKAIATLFTPNGQIVDKYGNAFEGRDAIERTFKELFSESPQKRIEVFVDSIRFLGPDLALEEGSTKETITPGETPEYGRYTVLHVKRDGKWLMALAQDLEGDSATPHEELLPLGWLTGEWIDDGGNVVVYSSCRWSEDGNFLLQEFRLQVAGQNATRVNQRIGWDPLAKQIHSWVFDSEGGFGESCWTRNGDNWIIKATGVRPDGKTASATNQLVRAGKDAYVWRSTDRIVGGEITPSIEVKVVRKGPQPQPRKSK